MRSALRAMLEMEWKLIRERLIRRDCGLLRSGTTRRHRYVIVHVFVGLEVFFILHLAPCNRCCMSIDNSAIGSVVFDLILLLCFFPQALQGIE